MTPSVAGTRPPPVVIAGLPRSGTTWTMRALGTCPGTRTVFEPDNENILPAAIHGKQELGRYPCLAPGQDPGAYGGLWAWILNGAHEDARARLARRILGPGKAERTFDTAPDLVTRLGAALARDPRAGAPCPDRVVVKSIHAALSIEWIDATFDVTPLVLLRHPGNVLASWMEIGHKDGRNATLDSRPDIRARYVDRWGVPLPGPDPVEQMSWRICLLTAALEEAVAAHPGWHLRTHEQLCTDPVATFRALVGDLGLTWSDATEAFLIENDTPGEGYATKRVAADVVDSWRSRLDDAQLATLTRVLGWFPVTTWSAADLARDRPAG